MMRVAFIKDDGTRGENLVKKCKDIMSQKGELIHQKDVYKRQFLNIGSKHPPIYSY